METTEQGPWLTYNGQPYSREMAVEALAAFDADKDGRVKAALNGDVAAQQERRDLWMLARGQQPGAVPAMPLNEGAVAQQMGEREAAIHEAQVDAWAAHTHPTDEARFQMKRGLATREQVEHARNEIRRAKGDPEFARKVTTPGIGTKEKEMWAAWHFAAYHCREVPDDFDWSKAK